MKTFLAAGVLLLMCSCVPDAFPGKALQIGNNSSERIYFWYSADHVNYHYPDTILPVDRPLYINSAPGNGGAGAGVNDPDWQGIFAKLPEGKFTIYFFDEYAATQEEWEDVRANHLVLRKEVTLEEIAAADYYIYYP